jgi:hypothetical protein
MVLDWPIGEEAEIVILSTVRNAGPASLLDGGSRGIGFLNVRLVQLLFVLIHLDLLTEISHRPLSHTESKPSECRPLASQVWPLHPRSCGGPFHYIDYCWSDLNLTPTIPSLSNSLPLHLCGNRSSTN